MIVERGVDKGPGEPWAGVDAQSLERAVRDQAARPVPGAGDMASYLAAAVSDVSHREVVGPILDGGGASGVVLRRGAVLASWGDPARAEMAFSATKSVLALVAGVAFDDGRLHLDEPASRSISLPQLAGRHGQRITWRHLLDQTSQWEGELWGKPTAADAQSRREGTESTGGPPGAGWAYNDVRVNLTALALTVLLGRPLPEVLRSRVMEPVGASSSWSWHGYAHSVVNVGGRSVPVVSGGAHWGGGLWISALERRPHGLARRAGDRTLRSRERRRPPAVDRPGAGPGNQLTLGRAGRVAAGSGIRCRRTK